MASEVVETLQEFRKKQDKLFSAKKPNIASACLVAPPEPPDKPNISNPVKNTIVGALSGLIMMFSVLFWLLMFFINPMLILMDGSGNEVLEFVLGILSLFLLIGSIIFWFKAGSGNVSAIYKWQKNQKEWKEKQKEWEAKFNENATKKENERFYNEFKEYDACFLNLVAVCSQKYADEFKRYEAGLEASKEKYLNKLDRLHNELAEVSEQLDNVTLIHSDLFDIARRISSMLKTGRADSLKEAINLSLDEERKDMEEAARRAEARQQEAILEQQARDNRIHNVAMQRAAEEETRAIRAHNAAMERAVLDQTRAAEIQASAAEAQAREAARQTKLAQKQAQDAQRAASARCFNCANYSKCSTIVRQNAVNCSGYRPK